MIQTKELEGREIKERNYSLDWFREKISGCGLNEENYLSIYRDYRRRLSRAYDEVWNIFTCSKERERAKELKDSGIARDVLLLYKIGIAAFEEDNEIDRYLRKGILYVARQISRVDGSLVSRLGVDTDDDGELFSEEEKKRVEELLDEMRGVTA